MKPCNKLNPNCPPDISGEFEALTTIYGNYNGKVIPLDKPLTFSGTRYFEQNELFVKVEAKFERESAPGVWRKKYDQNLNFAGWELYHGDSINHI